MAGSSYTEDLNDLSLAENDGDWLEFTSLSYNGQGSTAGGDGDYPAIEGSFAVTQDCSKDASIGSLGYDNSGDIGGHGVDGAYLVWQNYMINSNVDTYANGGFRLVVGTTAANFLSWDVGGSNKGRYPYGGWQCHAVNTSVGHDDQGGSGIATEEIVGAAVNVITGSSKGETHNVDAIRYGRCSAIFTGGEAADYCEIAGFAALNDASSWGLIQTTPGGYLWKGRMALGSAGAAVDFRDTGVNIFIDWTPKVTANFNTIDVSHIDSNVEMTGFTFQVLDITTASRGRWITTNDAAVALTSCNFIDMNTFVFDSNTTIDTCTFRRCGLVTQGGSDFDDCLFDEPSATGFLMDDANLVDNCDWISDGTGYAIELDASMAGNSYTLSGCSWTGYAGIDGDTGNECILNDTGGEVTLAVGTGQTPTVHNVNPSTTIIDSSVPLYIIVKDVAGDPIVNAQVYIATASGGAQIYNDDTDGAGEVDTSYSAGVPQSVIVWIRKGSNADDPRYKSYSSEQTIAAVTGLSLAVTLVEDPNNNATT